MVIGKRELGERGGSLLLWAADREKRRDEERCYGMSCTRCLQRYHAINIDVHVEHFVFLDSGYN